MGIQVTADGHVHVGNNEWVSLEKIQQAVLKRQHPTLSTNCPHCQAQMNEEIVDYHEELQRIEAMPEPRRATPPKKRRQVVNFEQEALELPSTLQRKPDDRKQIVNQQQEHLPLPSTMRR